MPMGGEGGMYPGTGGMPGTGGQFGSGYMKIGGVGYSSTGTPQPRPFSPGNLCSPVTQQEFNLWSLQGFVPQYLLPGIN